ncbi:MAG: NAD(P)/FAD-dependent oxidoreductase, partial [Pacificimonas sp.]
MPAKPYDIIILGAGGAGLMAAFVAGRRGRKVLVVDHGDTPGRKILISGGGRCNFTNVHTAPDRFLSANKHFAKSALSRYTAQDFIDLVDSHAIAWHEKTLGQLFCDGSARQVVDMLMNECRDAGVEFSFGKSVGDVTRDDQGFSVSVGGFVQKAEALIVATGGPSIPKIGATGFAYDLARKFGLKVVEPRPALVPFTLGGNQVLFRELSGVSADVVATCGKTSFREAALFTHKGLSGPAILQISSYWQSGEDIAIDFLPDRPTDWLVEEKRARPRVQMTNALGSVLPDRLASVLASRIGIDGELANVPDRKLAGASTRLHRWAFNPNGTEGFAKAEVTAGGISTAGLSSKTMAAKDVPGLYFIGEGVDVTGWLGGYNFQWAWA